MADKSIMILWGEDPREQLEETYTFKTSAEISAFRQGVEASQGWHGYEIVYTDEELDDGTST